ncbi:MAG: ATP-binding protein [Polyangiaceae bacterium]
MRALAVIDRQVEQISRLVDDLLDVTRITRGRVDVEKRRLELNGLVRRVVEDHQGVFDRGGVRLSLQESRESLLVRGDAQRLAQVVGHLLLNAAKFTPQGGAARVVLAEDRETGHAVVRVVDSGVGVAPDILPRLFKPFVQVGAGLSRSKGGVGLGLALVKSVIDLHGGEVTAWSRGLSQGLEVVLTLPLDTGELEESRGARRSREPERARVLLIEDNIDAAETLRDAMELSDHEVRIAHDGPTGIEMAREFQPDIVFCDIGLPGMDGFAVARELRSDEALRGVFLVALTGYAQPEDRRLATSAGFDEHVPKPPVLRKLDVLISLAMSRAPVSSSL